MPVARRQVSLQSYLDNDTEEKAYQNLRRSWERDHRIKFDKSLLKSTGFLSGAFFVRLQEI